MILSSRKISSVRDKNLEFTPEGYYDFHFFFLNPIDSVKIADKFSW